METKQTKPPNPYTEATLLTAMEYAGKFVEDEELREKMGKLSLGTPATRASIIERLLQVGCIVRKNKRIAPDAEGNGLNRILPNELKSPEMTGKWERALERDLPGHHGSQPFYGQH
ncbi:MAG: DNA topoisomerase [Clostridia bacterium]